MEAVLYTKDGETKQAKLKKTVFGLVPRAELINEAVTAYLANQRRGTASTKQRSEVRGGGRKPWRQKGTGRARAGSIRSPLWRGGGIVFGPHPKNWHYTIPNKKRRLAIRHALSDLAQNKKLIIIEELNLSSPKTKEASAFLKKMEINPGTAKILIADQPMKQENRRAFRNIEKLEIVPVENMNIYLVLWADVLLLTKKALAEIEELWG